MCKTGESYEVYDNQDEGEFKVYCGDGTGDYYTFNTREEMKEYVKSQDKQELSMID